MGGEIRTDSIRRIKLLAGRGLEKVSEVSHDYGNVGTGEKGYKAGQDVIDEEEEEKYGLTQ
eukprot:CAMPEP_0119045202 /NCGR_PEP_ID=MMETSP1177-20130426/37976_1 /TAXON_ID=2985 /ORGANISM="Ochromonas sp, Strain CCMP1899" /LENGTH=60 /DNA_ID=CAMNT_0007016571 /DNA_START=10 /DNA_END=192 /DNA_ORIENTATION=+